MCFIIAEANSEFNVNEKDVICAINLLDNYAKY
jgi:hypothetical protein